MVEAAAAVDYVTGERPIDTEGWLVWNDNGRYKNSFRELVGAQVCVVRASVWVCVIPNVIIPLLWDNGGFYNSFLIAHKHGRITFLTVCHLRCGEATHSFFISFF